MITIICTSLSCLQLTDDCGEDDEAEGQRCKYDDNQVKILHQGELHRLSSFSDRGEQQTTDDTISYWSRFASSIKLLNIKLKGLPSPKRCHSHQGVFINYVTGGRGNNKNITIRHQKGWCSKISWITEFPCPLWIKIIMYHTIHERSLIYNFQTLLVFWYLSIIWNIYLITVSTANLPGPCPGVLIDPAIGCHCWHYSFPEWLSH